MKVANLEFNFKCVPEREKGGGVWEKERFFLLARKQLYEAGWVFFHNSLDYIGLNHFF